MIEAVEPPFSGQAPAGHVFSAVSEAGSESRTPITSLNNYVVVKPDENRSAQGWPESGQRAASRSPTSSDLWAALLRG